MRKRICEVTKILVIVNKYLMNNIVIHKIKSVAYNSYEFSQNKKMMQSLANDHIYTSIKLMEMS